jgi:ketosteroid isomerase-like protein
MLGSLRGISDDENVQAAMVLGLMGLAIVLGRPANAQETGQANLKMAQGSEGENGKMGMTNEEAKRFLQQMFDTFCDPNAPIEKVTAFFSPDYVQDVDGKVLNYAEFVKHLGVLKSTVEKEVITLQKVATNGPTVADIHIVDAQKKNGETIRLKVIAFYTIENGKIVRLEELTHLLKGSAEDRDLGSRLQ